MLIGVLCWQVAEIVGELKEYVTDVDIEVARISIRTIGELSSTVATSTSSQISVSVSLPVALHICCGAGRIAWRLENSAARVIQELLGLLEVKYSQTQPRLTTNAPP